MLKPASTAEAATGTPAAKATAAEAATASTASAATARTTEAAVTRTTGTTAEDVETVDDVKHGVLVDGVVPSVAAHHFVDGARQVRLTVQQVVKLQADGERVAPQEALRHLCVPDELVGIHGGIAESAPAVHVQVGGYACTPRQGDIGVEAVGEGPCVEVRRGLH